MPVCAFAGRQIPAQSGPVTIALAGAGAALALGFVLWQTVDRWFGDAFASRAFARQTAGPTEDGTTTARADDRAVDGTGVLPAPAVVCAPPPPAGPVAVLSTRSGSAADFAAEILETKKRLSETPGAFFTTPLETAPNPLTETKDEVTPVARPRSIHLRIGPGHHPAAALTTLAGRLGPTLSLPLDPSTSSG
jgi:hypothetical protein